MADTYIDVPITTDEETLADNAVDRLQTEWDGDWSPNEGDLEVVIIEVGASMIADAADTASQVPAAVFRAILEDLHGVQYIQGTPATTTVTFTLNDTTPNVLEAGTELDIDGYAFTVDQDTQVAGPTLAGVEVTAADVGTEFNGLTGVTTTMITAVRFVDGFTVDSPTANGTDTETDDEFQDRGSRELELQAKTLVTTRDYELMTLSFPFVGRVIAQSDTVNRRITVIASETDGDPLSTAEKNTVDAELQKYRQATWTVQYADPSVCVIGVTYQIHPYPEFMLTPLINTVNAALIAAFDPATWGAAPGGDAATRKWYIEPRVRKNEVIALIDQVPGVDYVGTVTITGSTGAVDAPTGDWVMPGTVPLAKADPTGMHGTGI